MFDIVLPNARVEPIPNGVELTRNQMNQYPQDLVSVIKEACIVKPRNDRLPSLPSDTTILTLLDVAYHASFQTEEGRRPSFRLIFYSPEDHKRSEENTPLRYYIYEPRLLLLDRERPYTVAEVNRISPAAEYSRFLICVRTSTAEKEEDDLVIWALLDLGENWWKFVHHESSGGTPPPNFLTVSSTAPGELSVSAAGRVFASLQGGRISLPTAGALWQSPLQRFFHPAQRQLYKDTVSRLETKRWDDEGTDDEYPYRFYNFFLERILFHTRRRAHGGTIIVIRDYVQRDDTRLTDRVNIKYPGRYNYPWELLVRSLMNHRRYYDLHFPLWDAKLEYTKELFQEHCLLNTESTELDEALGDVSQTIASLTSVDGAVVMTDHFNVLGFGAEVIASSPSLSQITSVAGIEAKSIVPVESFGTRHRSAFRFCSSFEDAVAFIVSQDGGVKAVKRTGKDVVIWPDINTGQMGI